MNDNGFIKLNRKFFSTNLWKEPRIFSECEAWLDLIQSARFAETPSKKNIAGKEVIYSRGQFPASIRFLSKRWKWTERKVRTFLSFLKKEEMINTQTISGQTVITLCNYDKYNENLSDTANDTPFDTANDTDNTMYNNEVTHESTQQMTHPLTQQMTQRRRKNKEERIYKNILLSEVSSDDFNINSDYLKIAKSFHGLFKKNLEEAGASTKRIDEAKGAWIDPIRLLIESDGYTKDDLREAYTFLQKDEFWKQNILSTKKLREQMDKIKLKIKNGKTIQHEEPKRKTFAKF